MKFRLYIYIYIYIYIYLMKRNREQVSLKATTKYCERRCSCWGRPFHTREAATGNDPSPAFDRRVRRTTNDDDDADRSLNRACESADRLNSSYGGAVPSIYLYTRTASLKSILSFAFNQWSWRRRGVMWPHLDDEWTSRAAAFISDWSRRRRCWEMPASVAFS